MAKKKNINRQPSKLNKVWLVGKPFWITDEELESITGQAKTFTDADAVKLLGLEVEEAEEE